jgi:hypothetical protein
LRVAAAAAFAVIGALAAPVAADAAALAVAPVKPCYSAGERIGVGGAGFTPNGSVQVNVDGVALKTVGTNSAGNFAGLLTLGDPLGERVKTYSAIDTADNANQASVQLRVATPAVAVTPSSGRADRLLRLRARGFNTGTTLYAHIVRGHHQAHNVKIGRLKGDCGKLNARKRLFSKHAHSGTYRVQFDTRRRYSSKTSVRYRLPRVTVRPVRASAGAAQTWTSG